MHVSALPGWVNMSDRNDISTPMKLLCHYTTRFAMRQLHRSKAYGWSKEGYRPSVTLENGWYPIALYK